MGGSGAKCACGDCGLRVARKGCFRPGHQAVGTSTDPLGKIKAAAKIYNRSEKGIAVNAKNNAIYSAKVQEAARVENEERIAKMSKKEAIISKDAAYFLVLEMVQEPQLRLGRWCSLADILGVCPSELVLSFYFGYTRRRLVDEYLSFLTVRGSAELDEYGEIIDSYSTVRNEPVLLWRDGSVITKKEAEGELGFKCVELYASPLKLNARRVEEALQQYYQHVELGVRLWRCPDKGSKYDTEADANKVHKVFLTYSPRVIEMLRKGTIKINLRTAAAARAALAAAAAESTAADASAPPPEQPTPAARQPSLMAFFKRS